MLSLIPAHDFSWYYENDIGFSTEELEQRAALLESRGKEGRAEVTKYIEQYISDRNSVRDDIVSTLEYILSHPDLDKVKIVGDGSYANFCVLVRPDDIKITGSTFVLKKFWPTGGSTGYKYPSLHKYINTALGHGEVLFLNMTHETLREELSRY